MTQKERMLNGLPYKAWLDGLAEERSECRHKLWILNTQTDWANEESIKEQLIDLFGEIGDGFAINPPFCCDYGKNIFAGKNFFANYGCSIVDVAKVSIGDNVLLGPNVTICTAGHPVHHKSRNTGYEYGREISIGSNTWIGMNACVNPGVSIGEGCVIGAGSVVTKDIPNGVVAVGNPCKVLRKITEDDRDFYFKKLSFDVDDYK